MEFSIQILPPPPFDEKKNIFFHNFFYVFIRPGYLEITVLVLTNMIAARDQGLKIIIIEY